MVIVWSSMEKPLPQPHPWMLSWEAKLFIHWCTNMAQQCSHKPSNVLNWHGWTWCWRFQGSQQQCFWDDKEQLGHQHGLHWTTSQERETRSCVSKLVFDAWEETVTVFNDKGPHCCGERWFGEFQDCARCSQCCGKGERENKICDTCQERSVLREYWGSCTQYDNIMLVGDGLRNTIITSARSVQDGYTTYSSATAGKWYSSFSFLLLLLTLIIHGSKIAMIAIVVAVSAMHVAVVVTWNHYMITLNMKNNFISILIVYISFKDNITFH